MVIKTITLLILVITASSLGEVFQYPQLIVFNVVNVLWPPYINTDARPPFHKDLKTGKILDKQGNEFQIFPEIESVLEHLTKKNVNMTIASSTRTANGQKKLIKLLGWRKYFMHMQIYPGQKAIHINKISKLFKIHLDDILYFDSSKFNDNELERIGIVWIRVNNGMTGHHLLTGLKKFTEVKRYNERDH